MNLSYGKVNKSRVSGVAIYAPGFYPPSELKPELRTGVYGFNKGVVAIRKRNPRSRVNKVKYGFVCKAVRFTPQSRSSSCLLARWPLHSLASLLSHYCTHTDTVTEMPRGRMRW